MLEPYEAAHSILICATCEGPGKASSLRSALVPQLPDGFVVRPVDCMAGCDRPVTVGVQASGKASYLFGSLQSAAEIEALADFAHQYAAHRTGWTSASERPAALSDKTLARLPGTRGAGGSGA